MTPRSYLFVPGNRPDRFDKALASGADRVVLDLEDAVAPDDKDVAREAVARWLTSCVDDTKARLVVRINDATTPWFARDLAMLAESGAGEVMLPKAESAEVIAVVRRVCPAIAVLPLVESARGVQAAERIASAPGVQRLVFGTIDFALDLGLSGDAMGFDAPASRLAIASRAAGIASPVGGVTVAITDDQALREDVARMRAHGFGAKLCIHPRQVSVLHDALRPTADEVAWARKVLDATDGRPGAVQLDGQMIDRPVVERARSVLARA